MTNISLIKSVSLVMGKNWEDLIEFVEDRKGHDKRYSVSTDKIRKEINQKSSDFKEALSQTIDYYRNLT